MSLGRYLARWPLILGVAGVVASACPALAQTSGGSSPEFHQYILKLALDNFAKARCEANQACAPATNEERQNPPISDDQALRIFRAAVISTTAEHCGLDWQRRNFEPLMTYHRDKLALSPRQMALVGLMHGIAMGALGDQVRQSPCTADVKAWTEQRLLSP
jgi:hypothetical protein